MVRVSHEFPNQFKVDWSMNSVLSISVVSVNFPTARCQSYRFSSHKISGKTVTNKKTAEILRGLLIRKDNTD